MDILRENLAKMVTIRIGKWDEDLKELGDAMVTTNLDAILLRVLKQPVSRYFSITIRSYKNGWKTELHKIKQGYGKWMLFGWEGYQSYVLVDVDRMRRLELFSKRREVDNRDGTKFLSIPIIELAQKDCVVDCSSDVMEVLERHDVGVWE